MSGQGQLAMRLPGATVGRATVKKDIVDSDDWEQAKAGDIEAADRVIDALWGPDKTKQLKQAIDPTRTVFISQPSTSRRNVLALQLAVQLAGSLKNDVVAGDDYYTPLHSEASKTISRSRRVFNDRTYAPYNLTDLKNRVGDKSLCITEDLLTTGGSVRSFYERLVKDGFKVGHVAALMGDRRLQPDRKTLDRLDAALKEKGVGMRVRDIQPLTRTEAGILIQSINWARSDHAKEKLTKDLRGIRHRRAVANPGRDQQPGRDPGTERKNPGNGRNAQGIQDRGGVSRRNTQAGVGRPIMLVVAGVNGAGKSSRAGRDHVNYIDPDKVVKKISEQNPGQGRRVGWKAVLRQVNDHIRDKKDFTIESTLSGKVILKQMRKAKASGFEVRLKYITLDSVDRYIERVAARVLRGGHHIAEEDIRRRFTTSYQNLPRAMALAEKVTIYDNTTRLKPLLKLDQGKIIHRAREMPDQLKAYLHPRYEITIRDKVVKVDYSDTVRLKVYVNKSLEDQKKAAIKEVSDKMKPHSGKLEVRIEKMDASKELQIDREQSRSRGF